MVFKMVVTVRQCRPALRNALNYLLTQPLCNKHKDIVRGNFETEFDVKIEVIGLYEWDTIEFRDVEHYTAWYLAWS